MSTIGLRKRLKRLSIGLAATLLTSSSLMTAAVPFMSAPAAYAKDASHTGMTYLEVQVNTGGNTLNGVVNTEGQFNSWGGSDVAESTEYKKEQITWGNKNWTHITSVLGSNGKDAPDVPDGSGKSGGLFTTAKKGETFKERYKDLHEDGKDGGEAVSLTMSFPGWGAGDRIPDVSAGNTAVHATAGGDRSSNEDSTFADIDGTAASNAASAVNNKLIGDLNAAIQDFTARMRTSDGKKVQLSREGMINVVWLLANGYFPKPGTTVTYDAKTSKVDMTNLAKGKMEIPSNAWKLTEAGEAVAKIKPPGGQPGTRTSGQSGEDYTYTYAVVKGYQGGVGESGSPTYASDAYALSWYDVAMSLSAQVAYNTVEDQSEASSTVVGDQVGSFMYTAVSGLLSLLQIKKVDDLVFGEAGNLLKGGVFNILMVVQTPFIIASILILGLVILDAYRKSNMAYLSTGEQRSIMSSVGRVTNALIAIALTPLGVMLLIYLDQEVVNFAIGINAVFAGFNYGTSFSTAMESLGWFGDVLSGFAGLGVNAVMAIVMAGVDIKYTWRYIARAISFALYFCIAPVLFALDALKGSGRIFEFGPTAGMIWKNLTGTVLMRGIDALGIVFSLHLGRILFGSGMLIKILSLLSAEAITNTIAGMLGVSDTSVKGLAQTGEGIFNKAKGALTAAGSAAAAVTGARVMAAVKSGKNLDHQEILKAKTGDRNSRPKAGDLEAFNSGDSSKTQAAKRSNSKLDAVKAATNGSSTGVPESGAAPAVAAAVADGTESGGTGTVALAGGVDPKSGDMSEEVVPVSGAAHVEDTGYEGPVHDNGLATVDQNGDGLNDKTGQPVVDPSDKYAKADARRAKLEARRTTSTKSGWTNLLKQGFYNNGITGDKNTPEGEGMTVKNNRQLNPNDYIIDKQGRVKARTAGVATRDFGRNLGRGVGAFGSTFAPGNLGKTLALATFAGTSTVTKGNLDNMAAAAITANMMEKTLTGSTKSSIMGNFSRSFIGRGLGMNSGAFTFDDITADGAAYNSAMGGEASSEASKELAKYSVKSQATADGLKTRTSFDSSVKNKADRAVHEAAAGLHARGTHSSQGITTMSLNQVIDSIDDNAFGQVNPQYAQLAQYMTESGYDKMRFDGDNVAFDKTIQNTETVNVADAQGQNFETYLRDQLERSQDGTFHDQNGIIYKRDADGNAMVFKDTGSEARSTMANYYGGQTAAALKAGDGAELKSLLKQQAVMASNPEAFKAHQEAKAQAAAAAKMAEEEASKHKAAQEAAARKRDMTEQAEVIASTVAASLGGQGGGGTKLSKREPITRGKQPQD